MRRTCSLLALLALAGAAWAQTAGAAPAGGGDFRVVRSVSGSEGVEQNGRFTITDPRSVFHIPADKKVLVYFDWEGPLGEHHFEGYWKNPEGRVVVISDFKYTARTRRFGGYWELDLSPATVSGVWTLDARIDGETAGSHSFQIVQSTEPAATPVRRVLQPSEAYKRILASAVTFQKLDSSGHAIGTGLGSILEPGLVLTAFQVIDGASTLRLRFPDGRQIENPQVAWWDRLRDLALLRAGTGNLPGLERAAPDSWSVGDRVYALDVAAEGGTVLKDEGIFGLNDNPLHGPRINITDLHSPASAGGAVVNEYGEVVGVVGGSLFPGMVAPTMYVRNVQWLSQATQGSLATPISAVPKSVAADSGKSLADLAQAGQFVPPLASNDDLLYGSLGDEVKPVKGSPFSGNRQQKNEFSRTQGKIGVSLSWSTRAKLKGTLFLRVFDLQNRLIFESKPLVLKLGSGQMAASSWNLDISQLHSGDYRVDVSLEQAPIWRAFMRITD